MSFLHTEIHEQPEVVQRLLTEEAENVKHIAQVIRDSKPAFVLIAARGTSDNAARYAQYTLGIFAGMPVALATPSVHTLYEAQVDMSKAFVIGISQSGKSEDVALIVQDARKQGAKTLSITNDPESLMAQAAEYHIWLRCGEEKAVAATKTYTTQLTALAMLTAYLVDDATMVADLTRLPQFIGETLQNAQVINDWAERYRYIERIAVIGRGLNYCTAFEVALKIKELCYVVGEEYSEADFRHGPIAIVSRGFPVIVITPKGKTHPLLIDLLQKLNEERKAECIVFSNDDAACALGIKSVKLPDMPEWLSPVCAVVPGQMLAYRLAEAKGHDVDRPEGLTKVTITR
jgi:glutamine---fructose-6-phosphate transaminase (isomerizing)